ncbi:MAG: hypothetical protein ABJM86_10220, partial [Hyphomicrobiales bacterium]
MDNGLVGSIQKLFQARKAKRIAVAVEKFTPRWFREKEYDEERFEQHKEDRERRSYEMIGLQLDTGLSADELKKLDERKKEAKKNAREKGEDPKKAIEKARREHRKEWLKNQQDQKIKKIAALLRDGTLRLDRRKLDGSLDMTFRCTMAQLLEDCHFGPYSKDAGRKKEGRPTNEEVGKPLKNEIEIGLRYRELEASGVKTKAERIAILSEEFDR